jgi:hypothetical protein
VNALVALLVMAGAQPLSAAGPKIKLMEVKSVAGAMPVVGPVKLTKGQLYVIECKVKCDVLTFPEGVVSVGEKTGPRDVTALFPGGTGDYEDRTFAGPFLYILKAQSTGPVQVVVVPFGYQDKNERVSFTLDVDAGQGPRPPPVDPFDGKVFNGDWRILIIEETNDAAANRSQFFTDKALTSYIAAKCKSKPRWADQNVTDSTGQVPADLAPYLSLAKGKKLPQCFIVGSDGTLIRQFELPATPAAFLAELKKVGGQ